MEKLQQILEKSLLAQISLEEKLYKEIERQLSQSNIGEYPEVKEVLSSINEVLGRHYDRLNITVDQVIQRMAHLANENQQSVAENGSEIITGTNNRIRRELVSQMLHDDFAALNLVAMGNTLIHTTALAADSQEIADVALEHLANLTHFVGKMSELVPRVIARELSIEFPEIKATIGDLAAKNIQKAWRSIENELKKIEKIEKKSI